VTLEAEPVSPGEALSGKLSGKLSTSTSKNVPIVPLDYSRWSIRVSKICARRQLNSFDCYSTKTSINK